MNSGGWKITISTGYKIKFLESSQELELGLDSIHLEYPTTKFLSIRNFRENLENPKTFANLDGRWSEVTKSATN